MLNETDLSTIRAALWFWQQESPARDPATERHNFVWSNFEPPANDEVGRLPGCTLHVLSPKKAGNVHNVLDAQRE